MSFSISRMCSTLRLNRGGSSAVRRALGDPSEKHVFPGSAGNAYFSSGGSRTASAIKAASATSSSATAAKPALSEVRANAAALIGPTMNAIACAALAMPNAVPRRSRLTLSAIMVLVAGIIAEFRNEEEVKAITYSHTVWLSASASWVTRDAIPTRP